MAAFELGRGRSGRGFGGLGLGFGLRLGFGFGLRLGLTAARSIEGAARAGTAALRRAVTVGVPTAALQDETGPTGDLTLGVIGVTMGTSLERGRADGLLSLPAVPAGGANIFISHRTGTSCLPNVSLRARCQSNALVSVFRWRAVLTTDHRTDFPSISPRRQSRKPNRFLRPTRRIGPVAGHIAGVAEHHGRRRAHKSSGREQMGLVRIRSAA